MALRAKSQRSESTEERSSYRRRSRPVPVRGGWRDWRGWPWRRIAPVLLVGAALLVTLWTVRDLLLGSERFRLAEGERGLVVTGAERIDELDLRKLFAGDHGKSLLEIPMAERQAAVVETAWVSRARVVRLWPNRIWVDVVERRPVAYVRVEEGGASLRAKLIDSEGVLLEPIAGAQLELPILDGIDRSMARPEREKRIRLIERMMAELDSEEPQLSGRVSQVDVSDPKNAKVVVLHEGDVIELELGDELFRHRFEIFDTYIASWKKQYGPIGSIDLTLDEQVVFQPLSEISQARTN